MLVASEAGGLTRGACGGVSGCRFCGFRGRPLLVMRGQARGRAVRRRVSAGEEPKLGRGWRTLSSRIPEELAFTFLSPPAPFFPFLFLVYVWRKEGRKAVLFVSLEHRQKLSCPDSLLGRCGRRGFRAAETSHCNCTVSGSPLPRLPPSRGKRERPGGWALRAPSSKSHAGTRRDLVLPTASLLTRYPRHTPPMGAFFSGRLTPYLH